MQSGFDVGRSDAVRAGMQSDADTSAGALRRLQPRRVRAASAIVCSFASILRASTSSGTRPHYARLKSVRMSRESIASDTIWLRPYPSLLADPLTLTIGVDIQHFQTQFPAARFEASNAVTTTLRYRRRWASDASRQEVDAGYWLRAATRSLGSDYVYNRHTVTAEYRAQIGESVISAEFLAGGLNGTAPLFERFTLGDSRTLRGWSKFDVAPLGGTQVAHGSLEYTFHWVGFFYDTGSVWEREGEIEC